MGEKDLSEKILEDYNDVFADIINGLIFKGAQIIHPEELENASVHSQYKAEDTKLHEQERDTAKYWNGPNKIRLAILGVENQTAIDPMMPVRVIGYDGASYRKQMQEKTTEIVPVITIVLHFGTERRWDKSTHLRDLLHFPQEWAPYITDYLNDYQFHVFDIAYLTDEEISRFHSDFKIVANFFQKKREQKDYIPNDSTEFKHVDEVLKLLSVMTNDDIYERLIQTNDDRKELRNMCDVANRIKAIGEKEGELKGEKNGVIKTYAGLINDGLLTLPVAAARLNMSEHDFMDIAQQLGIKINK